MISAINTASLNLFGGVSNSCSSMLRWNEWHRRCDSQSRYALIDRDCHLLVNSFSQSSRIIKYLPASCVGFSIVIVEPDVCCPPNPFPHSGSLTRIHPFAGKLLCFDVDIQTRLRSNMGSLEKRLLLGRHHTPFYRPLFGRHPTARRSHWPRLRLRP